VLWDFETDWQLGLALFRAERAPASEELFSNIEAQHPQDWVEHAATGSIELGNPELDTEVSNNVDLSLRWQRDDHAVDIVVFYNDFSDYIGLLNNGQVVDETPVLAYTQDDAKFYGVEIGGEFALVDLAGGQLRLDLFADHIRGKLDRGGNVPRLPPTRTGGRLGNVWPDWELWTQFVYADDQNKPGDNERSSNGYTRWDIGGEYRLELVQSELMLTLELKNLGDEEVRLSTSFLRDVAPEAGRSLVATMRYTF
jgi:iron complex outermembrane receptor protein